MTIKSLKKTTNRTQLSLDVRREGVENFEMLEVSVECLDTERVCIKWFDAFNLQKEGINQPNVPCQEDDTCLFYPLTHYCLW